MELLACSVAVQVMKLSMEDGNFLPAITVKNFSDIKRTLYHYDTELFFFLQNYVRSSLAFRGFVILRQFQGILTSVIVISTVCQLFLRIYDG